jgi:hypothetical protein
MEGSYYGIVYKSTNIFITREVLEKVLNKLIMVSKKIGIQCNSYGFFFKILKLMIWLSKSNFKEHKEYLCVGIKS